MVAYLLVSPDGEIASICQAARSGTSMKVIPSPFLPAATMSCFDGLCYINCDYGQRIPFLNTKAGKEREEKMFSFAPSRY